MGTIARRLAMAAMLLVLGCGPTEVKTSKGTFRVPGKATMGGTSKTSLTFIMTESGREVPPGGIEIVELTGHRTVQKDGKDHTVFRVKSVGGINDEWFDERYVDPAEQAP